MEKDKMEGTGLGGCFLLLVAGTVIMVAVVLALKLPKEAERQALDGVLTPLSSVIGLGLLVLLAALFRR
jgi:hypothetical protein